MVVMSGDVGRWCGLFGTLVGVSVLRVMWLELESVSEISSPRWSSVYECQSVECAFTSPVIIELGMLVMYCMQFVMSVSVVSISVSISVYFCVFLFTIALCKTFSYICLRNHILLPISQLSVHVSHPYSNVAHTYHFSTLIMGWRSTFLPFRTFSIDVNVDFAMPILRRTSCLHLPSDVNRLPK